MATTKLSSDLGRTYDRLKLMILEGQIGRGEPLVERSVAERLQVSRTPVRETIIRLENEGLVRTIEGKGAFVASYSIDDLIEIYHLRQGLEPLAARLSCDRLPSDKLHDFEQQLERQAADPNLRYENPAEWNRLGREFHNLFIMASGNGRLIQIMQGLRDQVELFRGLHRTISPNAGESAIPEHLEILKALKARDPDRAESAVRVHLENGLRFRLEGLRRSSRAFAQSPGGGALPVGQDQ